MVLDDRWSMRRYKAVLLCKMVAQYKTVLLLVCHKGRGGEAG